MTPKHIIKVMLSDFMLFEGFLYFHRSKRKIPIQNIDVSFDPKKIHEYDNNIRM